MIKINLASSSGFCFGVKRALQIALKTAAECDNVYMLGNIVHNAEVVKQIEKAGIKKIKKLTKGEDKILLIQAHGSPQRTLEKARRLGYQIVDATCTMVKEIHKIVRRMEKQGYAIIVIGDKKHDEVRGIIGQLKSKAIIIEDSRHIPIKATRKIKRAAVVVQSTQNIKKVLQIVNTLQDLIRKLKFFNTICQPTRIKQEEINTMPLQNDVMIIIGSKTSANTRRLYEISKSLNRHSYWIQSKEQLNPFWFKDIRNVGIAAGASTPDSTTEKIVAQIRRLN